METFSPLMFLFLVSLTERWPGHQFFILLFSVNVSSDNLTYFPRIAQTLSILSTGTSEMA